MIPDLPRYRLPLLAVRDVDRSKAFYTGLFQQTVVMDFGENVTFSGGFAIQQDFDRLAELPTDSIMERAHNMELYFEVENFSAFLKKLKEFPEVRMVHPPKQYAWRQWVVRLYDPDFHILEVVEAMEVVVCRCLDEGMSEEKTTQVTQHPAAFIRHSVMRRECRDAENFWQDKESETTKMEPEPLLRQMEAFLTTHNTCALATGTGDWVRCTPIEYRYREGTFYLFSEGGLKFRALADNSQICLGIYDPFTGFGSLAGMQVTGRAELIPPWSKAYLAQLEAAHLSAEAIKKIAHPLHLIKILPHRIDYLWSGFSALGYSPRQFLEFPLCDEP